MIYRTISCSSPASRYMIVLCLFFGFAFSVSGQTDTDIISTEEAKEQVARMAEFAGFDQVYFSNTDLQLLMREDQNVRFYTVKKSGLFTRPSVMGVGANRDGIESGAYLRMDKLRSVELDREEAIRDLERSAGNDRITTFAATFSEADVRRLQEVGGTGILLMPGGTEDAPTFIISAAIVENGSSVDLGEVYIRHRQPCPPDCSGYLKELER